MIRKIEHVGIQTKNLERSISFYTEILGFRLIRRLNHPNGKVKLAFLGLGESPETELELLEGYNDSLPVEGKVHHLALNVDNIEAEKERLVAAGVTFIEKEITILPNGSRYIFFEGADGEWIELFETK